MAGTSRSFRARRLPFMPGKQFREVAAHEASQTVVDQPQTLRYGLQILVRRFVQAYRLGVFLHAAPQYGTSAGRAHHPPTGIELRFVLLEILPDIIAIYYYIS